MQIFTQISVQISSLCQRINDIEVKVDFGLREDRENESNGEPQAWDGEDKVVVVVQLECAKNEGEANTRHDDEGGARGKKGVIICSTHVARGNFP